MRVHQSNWIAEAGRPISMRLAGCLDDAAWLGLVEGPDEDFEKSTLN